MIRPRIGRNLLFSVCWCCALGAAALRAQDPEPRPKIGLVLSGGGARGCAHVGVLKVLEDLRIPIDFIAGTSMGSIVGGCYAYGFSPDRLHAEMVREGTRRPWAILLQDAPPRALQSFRRKQEQRGFLVDIGLGYRDGSFRFPKGLVQGQNLELELLQLLPEAHDLTSFDDLPIPFRAIGVELGTGKEIVLGAGNLVAAMRASMSLPGIFAPAEIDGRALLDGGLVNNVPIDTARAMGATRLIVIDIGTPLTEVEIASALDVSTQMVQILTQQNVDRSLALLRPGDIFIQPDLGDITSSDFERAAESIRIGEQATRAVADQLSELSVSDEEYGRYLARHRRQPSQLRVHQITIENSSGLGDEVIRGHLTARPDEALDLEQLRTDLEEVHGRGDFESVTFRLKESEEDGKDLLIRAREKSWGPNYIRFGISLESDLEGSSAFNLAAQVNLRELNRLGAEWRNDLQLGDESRLATEFYQPLAAGTPLFLAPRLAANTFEVDVVQGSARVAAFDVTTFDMGADLGLILGTWGEIRIGYTRVAGDLDATLATQTVPGFNFDDGFLEAQIQVDTLDYTDFPTSGVVGGVGVTFADRSLGADADYQKLSSGISFVGSLGRTTGILIARYETALDEQLPAHSLSSLGGFANLSGLARNELSGQHLGLISATVRHRIAGRHAETFGFPVYVGGSVETGNTWNDRDDVFRRLRMAGSVFVAVGTPLGPTYLAYGLAEGGADSFYLFVGQVF